MMALSAEATERLQHLLALVLDENARQNLIAPSTEKEAWNRHVVDSLQLLALAPSTGVWVDIGTGAGFPGLVVAAVRPETTHLVEPRRRRAEFLSHAADTLGCKNVVVHASKVENLRDLRADVISARAVATLPTLFDRASHLSSEETIWLLPKGRSVHAELAEAERSWQGVFHVEPSVTDPESGIVVAKALRQRDRR